MLLHETSKKIDSTIVYGLITGINHYYKETKHFDSKTLWIYFKIKTDILINFESEPKPYNVPVVVLGGRKTRKLEGIKSSKTEIQVRGILLHALLSVFNILVADYREQR